MIVGVKLATPPPGLAVAALTVVSPADRRLPPVATEVIMWVPLVLAVVPPCAWGVHVCVCVWLTIAETELIVVPLIVGTPAGQEMTCAGPVTVPFVPAAVTECVCAASAAVEPLIVCAATVLLDPVKVCAATVELAPVKVCAATVELAPVKV